MVQTRSQMREEMKTKRREDDDTELTGCESSTVNSGNDPLPQLPEKTFPWSRLPRELQMKILQNLLRCDLDRCQLVNREMFELIRYNGWSLKRRFIDSFEMYMTVRTELAFAIACSEEKVFKTMFRRLSKRNKTLPTLIKARLPVMLRDADIHRLEISETRVTRRHLESIASCLLVAECRVHELCIRKSSLDAISSTTLLQFLRDVAPMEIVLSGIHFVDCFSPEVLQFIVTRQGVQMTYFEDQTIPIDDSALVNLTATNFYIGKPNMITIDGLKSFVENLASGKQRLDSGIIFVGFYLTGVLLPSVLNVNLKVYWGGCYYTDFCTGETKDYSLILLD